jgi:hypothetical protein
MCSPSNQLDGRLEEQRETEDRFPVLYNMGHPVPSKSYIGLVAQIVVY